MEKSCSLESPGAARAISVALLPCIFCGFAPVIQTHYCFYLVTHLCVLHAKWFCWVSQCLTAFKLLNRKDQSISTFSCHLKPVILLLRRVSEMQPLLIIFLAGFPYWRLISLFCSCYGTLLSKKMLEGYSFEYQGVFSGTCMKGSPDHWWWRFCLWLIVPAVLQLCPESHQNQSLIASVYGNPDLLHYTLPTHT